MAKTILNHVVTLVGYVLLAVLLTAIPEWQNNVLANSAIRGWPGYFETLKLNAVLAVLAYGMYVVLRRVLGAPRAIIAQYSAWGVIGLLFEWFLVGNNPFTPAWHVGMFVYWASVFATPALLLSKSYQNKKGYLFYTVLSALGMWTISMVLLGLTLQPNLFKGLIVFTTVVSWVFVFGGYVHYVAQAIGRSVSLKRVWLFMFVVSLAEMLTFALVPVHMTLVALALFVGYRYVLRQPAS